MARTCGKLSREGGARNVFERTPGQDRRGVANLGFQKPGPLVRISGMSNENRHCHQCGWEWDLRVNPGRSESCHGCQADLRVCLNCEFHDLQAAHQCRERRAEPVFDKKLANYCEWFEFAKREWTGKPDASAKEDEAREKLRKLLGG